MLFCLLLTACSEFEIMDDKEIIEKEEETENEEENETSSFTDQCDLITYTDTLVFLENEKDDYRIRPLKVFEGEYGSIPEGLDIDHNNGEIRINKSESGLRYKVYFVPEKTTDTCFTYLTVSGVDYLSKIYFLNENDSVAIPYYNGQILLQIPDSEENEFDDGPDDDDNDGEDDEPVPGSEVSPQGVAINKRNGKIRLDKTVGNGVFGGIPLNGSSRKFRIYYRLGDRSGKSLNKIDVQFHYFDTEESIPADLKKKVEDLQQYYANFRTAGKNLKILKLMAKPRPPDVIIVGRRKR